MPQLREDTERCKCKSNEKYHQGAYRRKYQILEVDIK